MTQTAPARRSVWPWYAGVLVLLIADQATKYAIRANFRLHESIDLIGEEFLRLTYVQNPGIAFGLKFIPTTLLLIFGWTAVVLLAVYLFHLVRQGDPMRWPVLLFLSGAVGNSIDRTLFGKVTDFVDVDFPNFIMERWPVFNVADSCVTIGIALTALIVIRQYTRRHAAAAHASDVRFPDSSHSIPDHDRAGSTTPAD